VVRLRSPRPPAESARAFIVGIAVLSLGCEAVFGPPSLDEEGGDVDGEAIDSVGPEVATTTGAADPEPPDASEVGGEIGGGEIDGGETDANKGEDGPAFDLGIADLGGGAREDGGDVPPPVNDGDCCEVGMGVGCADDVVEACVCAVDPYCCETSWDELCVSHVEDANCGGCTVGPSSTDFGADCCEPSEMPGCPDEITSACVCDADPFCCMVEWDQVCVDTGVELGCHSCGDATGTTGDDYGTSSGGESETTSN
jgi:hypothetical protein